MFNPKSSFRTAAPVVREASVWLRPLSLLIGALIYSWLFGPLVDVGLNVLLFDLVLLGIAYTLDRPQWQSAFVRASTGGLLLAGVAVVLVHSDWSRVVHNVYLLAFLGYLQRRELRFVLFAGLLGIWSIGTGWLAAGRRVIQLPVRLPNSQSSLRHAAMVLLPILLGIPFFLLYGQGNPAFAEFFSHFYRWFDFSLEVNFSFGYVFCFGVGLLLLAGALYPGAGPSWLVRFNKSWSFQLRPSAEIELDTDTDRAIPLRQEYQIALISLATLNVLLLVANAADLRFLWLDFGVKSPAELSQYVHAGTWALIGSIFLAMLVILLFFRGDLNFYRAGGPLRLLAYVWLAQNVWLALGVGLRNGHYIHHYGLAYGRITVLFFLVLVLIGLWTMYWKIRHHKSLYFALQTNACAVMLVLLFSALINWDGVITRYNIHADTKQTIDIAQFEHKLSDKNLFLLIRHREKIYGKLSPYPIDTQFVIDRKSPSRLLYSNPGWRSWNWPDARNRRALR